MWQITGPTFRETEEMEQFRCAPCQGDERFSVCVRDEIFAPDMPCVHQELYDSFYDDGTSCVRLIRQERRNDILFKDKEQDLGIHEIDYDSASLDYYNNQLALRIMDMPRHIIRHSGIFLHASYIVADGQAILFTAPKQTGKSTQAELWRKTRHAEVINGDRAIVRKVGDIWYAYGSPYCGTSKICHNVTAPIKAIVILGKSEKNTVRMATPHEGVAAMLDGCTYDVWDKKQVDAAMTIMEKVITELPMVKLDCLPDESAVRALEEFLWQQTKA